MHSDPHGDERLRKVFSESPIGIAIVAPDFRILEVNSALCDLLGYHEHELIGMTFVDITHPDDFAIDVDLAEQLFAGTIPSYRIEKRYVTQSRAVVWVLLTASVIHDRDGRPLYGLGMVESIDERKQAEATLREYAKELERSNAELHEFTRVVSHDLKEPLRTIAGFSKLLERRLVARNVTDPDTTECLTSIEASCGQMAELVDGLLEYARIGDAGIRRISVDLELLLENTVQRLDVAMKETGASVEVDALPVVNGDLVLITQLFQNLIENALKFRTSKTPRIRVHGEHHDGEWRIAVSDNGIGIPERDAKRIFGSFERLHPRDYPGSGVGLAICRKIVERHGGRIWTEPAPDSGSSFVFTFPASP